MKKLLCALLSAGGHARSAAWQVVTHFFSACRVDRDPAYGEVPDVRHNRFTSQLYKCTSRLPLLCAVSVACFSVAPLAFKLPARELARATHLDPRRTVRWPLLSSLAAFILVVCCFMPSRYVMSFVMSRTLVMTQFVPAGLDAVDRHPRAARQQRGAASRGVADV